MQTYLITLNPTVRKKKSVVCAHILMRTFTTFSTQNQNAKIKLESSKESSTYIRTYRCFSDFRTEIIN